MKKTLSLILALMLALCCAVPAFAVSDTATPDEAPGVKSIEITKLPDKLVYDDVNDLILDMTEEDYEKIFEMETDEEINQFLASKMYLDIDLSGMEIQAGYSNGALEQISPDACDANVVDFPSSMDNPYGEYTVVVEYMGATDEYTIDFVEGEYEYDSIYELVSITLPEKTTYVFEEDAYSDVWEDEFDGEVYTDWYIDIDTTGLAVELYNTETGETEVYGEDSIYCEPSVWVDPDDPCGTYYVDIEVDADYDYYYDCFEVEVVSANDAGFGIYEFVSCTPPAKDTYIFEEDAYEIDDPDGLQGWYIDVDPTGMTVTLLNTVTGELETVDSDSIYCEPVYISPLKLLGNINAFAEVEAPDGDIISFTYKVKVISEKDADNESSGQNVSEKNKAGSEDEASPDEAGAVSNKTVNTGQVFPAAVVLFIVGCGAMVTMFAYKRKNSK